MVNLKVFLDVSKKRQPFVIAETLKGIDGYRTRLTNHWFETLEDANDYIRGVELVNMKNDEARNGH